MTTTANIAAVSLALPILPSCRSLKRNTSNYNRSVSITGKTNFEKELAKTYQDPTVIFPPCVQVCIDGIVDHPGKLPKSNELTLKSLGNLDEIFLDVFKDNSSDCESQNSSTSSDGIFENLADLPSPLPINTGSPWFEILSTESDSESTPKWK